MKENHSLKCRKIYCNNKNKFLSLWNFYFISISKTNHVDIPEVD